MRTPSLLLVLLAAPALAAAAPPAAPPRELRVCADPNNLPFSNAKGEGLENRLAKLLARELGARVTYTWHAQRRGFVRSTLKAGACDVVMGINADSELLLTTRPYYRSTYAVVQRADGSPPVSSLDDPALRRLRVGVQLVGDDYANTPPVHALSRRGIVENVRGYSVLGDYRTDAPTGGAVEAVAKGEVDVAIVWGPQAGYFARRAGGLRVTPLDVEREGPYRFAFDIALGVRRGEGALKEELERALARRRKDVDALLAEYGVPRPPAVARRSAGTGRTR